MNDVSKMECAKCDGLFYLRDLYHVGWGFLCDECRAHMSDDIKEVDGNE